MTQNLTLDNILIVLQALGLITLYWFTPITAVALAVLGYKRSRVRYHVGNPRVGVPVRTFRTKAAARKASIELYRAHRKCFRITTTR